MSEIMFELIKAGVNNPGNKNIINLINMQHELDCAHAMYSSVHYISADEDENIKNQSDDFKELMKKTKEIENKYRNKLNN